MPTESKPAVHTPEVTKMRRRIADIDKSVTRIHRELCRLERFDSLSSEGWQEAWDKHPALHGQEQALIRERGNLQRDIAIAEDERSRRKIRKANAAKKANKPNSHAVLVEALRELVRVVNGTLQGYGIVAPAIQQAERALALAEEQQ